MHLSTSETMRNGFRVDFTDDIVCQLRGRTHREIEQLLSFAAFQTLS